MLKSKLRSKLIRLRKSKFNNNFKINFQKIKYLIHKSNLKKPIIGGYYPVNYEIDCLEILENLEKQKFRICLPKIKKNNLMNFYEYSFKDPLTINKYGIPETISKNIIIPDILLVPLLGFDKKRFRLGYGGGYYDRYIDKFENKKKIFTIGLAYSFQYVEKLPVENFDKNLNYIITNKKIYK